MMVDDGDGGNFSFKNILDGPEVGFPVVFIFYMTTANFDFWLLHLALLGMRPY